MQINDSVIYKPTIIIKKVVKKKKKLKKDEVSVPKVAMWQRKMRELDLYTIGWGDTI